MDRCRFDGLCVRGRGGNRLDNLCDDYGVNRARRTHHGALLDCELLIEVMRAMAFIGGILMGYREDTKLHVHVVGEMTIYKEERYAF